MKIGKILIPLISVSFCLTLIWLCYLRTSSSRRSRNQDAAKILVVALDSWGLDFGTTLHPRNLEDLKKDNIIDEVPIYEGVSGIKRPFLYLPGLTTASKRDLVVIVAPEPEGDGTILVARCDVTVEYLTSNEALQEMQLTRDYIRSHGPTNEKQTLEPTNSVERANLFEN